MIGFLKNRWFYHSLIWIISFFAITSISFFDDNNSDNLISCFQEAFFFFIPIITVTYLGFWARVLFFDSRRYLLYFFAAIATVMIGVAIHESLQILGYGSGILRSQNIVNFAFVQLFTLGLQFFKRGIINQYQVQELKAKTAMTELNALKAQLNPHFLFNTLNNIYGMNQIDAEKGSEMIMELSDVMRYHLEFSKEGKVKLEDEIQLLNSYIKLEKLRLSDTCDVQINFDHADESLMISPLLFIPFVENAFKHGTHPTKDCFVHIDLRTSKENIQFTIKNSVINNRKVVKTNIGLQNTRRRLELIFPKKHNLKITKNEMDHLVELNIEL